MLNRYYTPGFFRLHSLKTKITLYSLIIFMLCIWSLAFYASRVLREDMQKLLGEQQFDTVSFIAAQIDDQLKARLHVLEKVAGIITPAMMADTALLQTVLQQRLILQEPFNAGVLVLDKNGMSIASLQRDTDSFHYLELKSVAAALKEGKSVIGSPFLCKQDLVFCMAAPIRDKQRRVTGAIIGMTDLGKANFLERLMISPYGRGGYYLLEDSATRQIITGSDKLRIMEQLPAAGVNRQIDRYMQGYEGSDLTVNPSGVEVLISSRRIPASGWITVGALPAAQVYAPIYAMQRNLLQATLLLTLLLGGLSWWMLRRLLAPLLAATKELAGLTHQHMLTVNSQDEIGSLICGFNYLLDILTKREAALRESKAALSERELHYRTVADFTSDWEYWILPDGTFRYNSPSCLEVSGYTVAEFNADPALLLHIIYPDDLPLYIAHVHRLTLQGVPEPIDFRIHNKSAELRWISHVCRPVYDPQGVEMGLRASNRDITVRKLAEDQLRKLSLAVEQSTENIMITDHHACIEYVNEAFVQSSGYSLSEVAGRNPRLLQSGKTPVATYHAMWDALLQGQGWRGELHNRRKDGTEYRESVVITPLRQPDGKISHYVAVKEDVTEKVRLATELGLHHHHLEELVAQRTADEG